MGEQNYIVVTNLYGQQFSEQASGSKAARHTRIAAIATGGFGYTAEDGSYMHIPPSQILSVRLQADAPAESAEEVAEGAGGGKPTGADDNSNAGV